MSVIDIKLNPVTRRPPIKMTKQESDYKKTLRTMTPLLIRVYFISSYLPSLCVLSVLNTK